MTDPAKAIGFIFRYLSLLFRGLIRMVMKIKDLLGLQRFLAVCLLGFIFMIAAYVWIISVQ
jgi:hypothetical protein